MRVKPATQQSNHQTKKEVRRHINPDELGIKSVRNGMNGAIVVECGNKNEAEGFANIINEKLGADYSAEIEQSKRPRIKILGVDGDYKSDELAEILKDQNGIEDIQFLKVLKCIPSKRNAENGFSLICEVDASTFERVMRKGKLDIDLVRCRVYETIELLRCFKCCAYGHKSGDCRNTQRCAKCAENHDIKNCTSDQEFCANCILSNRERKTEFDVDHSSWSVDCPFYLKKVEVSRSLINYEA